MTKAGDPGLVAFFHDRDQGEQASSLSVQRGPAYLLAPRHGRVAASSSTLQSGGRDYLVARGRHGTNRDYRLLRRLPVTQAHSTNQGSRCNNMRLIFETCQPRADVLQGSTRDEAFAADLASVISGTAPPEYADPKVFFQHTYPTRGLKALLKAVCQRLSGRGGEVASVIRLDTQYGGGKTHGLIATIHAIQGMNGVANAEEFVDPALLPTASVSVAAFDGENADPANGLRLEEGVLARSIWGELAYRLGGKAGFERVKPSDEKHVSPGAETIKELFGGKPTLIVLDEISVYLRKVERAFPGASDQITAFVHALCKAVEASPNVALVYTLAIGKEDKASDAYREENERAAAAFAEVELVGARKATQLNPTEEDETADVLRRRLFGRVDHSAAQEAVEAYSAQWLANRDLLPEDILSAETRDQFRRGYPLHPEVLNVLTKKTSTLSTFQRTRGMLRLLARTVHVLWKDRPTDAFAIHLHHIALGVSSIRDEVTIRLQQRELVPALNGDVEAVKGDEHAIAEFLDGKYYPASVPVTTYIARTVFLNTLAYNQDLKGISTDRLLWSVCSPKVEPSFIEQARTRFVGESDYLDDRPGAPLRFQTEPNLVQMIRKQMRDIEAGEVKAELDSRIRSLFQSTSRTFELIAFPGGPYEVPDDSTDGRPLLVLFHHDAVAVAGDPTKVPAEVGDIFQYKGTDKRLRDLRNNIVFLLADERQRENMRTQVRRRLALQLLKKPENIRRLADYQQRKLNEEFEGSAMAVAESILHCFRHLLYPSNSPMGDGSLPLAHTVIELSNASDQPGDGQRHIVRLLRDQQKLLANADQPNAPGYVRDQTPLRTKGTGSTFDLRNEFRRAPKLSILLGDEPLIACIREGIDQGVFVYREGDQVWGKGDPSPSIRISENAFVHTALDARNKHLWPRPEPLRVELRANPPEILPGASASLSAEISGGVPPYFVQASEQGLSVGDTESRSLLATVSPSGSQEYQIEIKDQRGTTVSAKTTVLVQSASGGAGGAPTPPTPPKPPGPTVSTPPRKPVVKDLNAEGPLAQALSELFDKARGAGLKALQSMTIRFFDASPAFRVQQAIATLQGVDSTAAYEAAFVMEGVENLDIAFKGRLDKASTLKSFLDAQIRGAKDVDFTATYFLVFEKGQATTAEAGEKLGRDLTKYGAGEAFVEAEAAPEEAQA